VVRNGRAETLVPTLASLDASANLPGCLMARTSVFDYNGVDWHRTTLMVKGGPVAVFDEAVAKEEGDYTLWCVWKTLDEGREEIADAQTYHTLWPGSERLPTPGFVPIKAADARGGEALVFTDQRAVIELDLKLPRGKYTMKLRGYATTGGNDSLWVQVTGQKEPLGFHFPKNAFGEAMGTWDLSAPSPKIEIAADRMQQFKISLREGPGLVLDTIEVADAGGKALFAQRALDVVAPDGKRLRTPDHHFYVANTGGPALQLSPRVNANNEAVKRLRQISNVHLAAGQGFMYQNLLASVFGAPAAPKLRRLGMQAFAARVGEEDYLFGVGDPERLESFGPLSVAARAFVVGKDKLWLMDGRGVALDGKVIHRSEKPETKEMAWPGPAVAALAGAIPSPPPAAEVTRRGGPAQRLKAAWQFKPDVEVYREGPEFLQAADLNGDSKDEVFYGAGNTLFVLSAEGKLLWRFAAKDRVRSCAVADVNKDGSPEVVLGSNDQHVHVLDSKGAEVRSWPCEVKLISGQGHGRDPEVTALAAADINGDGKVEILAGTRNCWIIAFTAEGQELWKDSKQYHGVRRILIADVNGDGQPDVLSANRYGGIRIYDGAGKAMFGTSSELGDASMALGRTMAGPLPTIVNGSSTGVLTGRRYKVSDNDFSFNNHGFGVNEVACADVNGDGLDEVLVASDTGYVYCLDGKGKEVWRALIGSVVCDLAAADLNGDGKPEVICGAEDGTTWILSGAGEALGTTDADSCVVHVAARPGLALSANRQGVLSVLLLKGK
jgi:outer membrane protein assembly factor BamB